MRKFIRLLGVLSLSAWLGLSGVTQAEQTLFAKVGGEAVSMAEFETAANVAMRQRFYHGRVDDERIDSVRHEVAGQLIDRVLLKQEALRRRIEIDGEVVDRSVERALRQFKIDDLSVAQRKHLMDMLREQETESLLVDELELTVAAGVVPDWRDVEAYYAGNLDKFTTPEQQHLSVILLKVTPSSPASVWQAAKEEAERLGRRLAKGADFAELARLHSGDASAEAGGDLGFVHQGMLSHDAQRAVDGLKAGDVSGPVALLQGVALFELKDVKEAVVNPYVQVKERARGLLQRQMVERKWRDLLESLREKTPIEMYDGEIIMAKIWVNESAVDSR